MRNPGDPICRWARKLGQWGDGQRLLEEWNCGLAGKVESELGKWTEGLSLPGSGNFSRKAWRPGGEGAGNEPPRNWKRTGGSAGAGGGAANGEEARRQREVVETPMGLVSFTVLSRAHASVLKGKGETCRCCGNNFMGKENQVFVQCHLCVVFSFQFWRWTWWPPSVGVVMFQASVGF